MQTPMLGLKRGKRSKIQIYYDVLRMLCFELCVSHSSLTKVAHMANLPYDRFQECLRQLDQLGMISNVEKGDLLVTEKGSEYVREFERINDFLRRIGLSSET